MPKRKPISSPAVPEWVLTYGDMMSLLLCFFILLAAFSELKKPDEYRRVLDAIKEALGGGGMGSASLDAQSANAIISQLKRMRQLDGPNRSHAQTAAPNVSGRHPQAQMLHQSDRIAIGGALEFEPGSYQLTVAMQQKLKFEIAPLIRDKRYIVHITGHAWSQADRAASGLSLAELSFRRGQAVLDYLTQECEVSPQILRVLAASDQEPVPGGLVPSDFGVSNRRVQLYQTGMTVDQTHPDPEFTGRDAAG
ncbi:MAG: hypothetical protein DYG94_09025 [Leptolyngbya sp. PLA3]|nr:MAG: hypothetical protein EDM82_02770 [Cyanobacteria bacterium CYA]MCE7968873.1 hypothetical protein [Leptolyngbya sp. PL-A3]